ncbi:MAG: glycosyltransferase family 9 protein [Candidatus Caenarcaniphilales bacterium]|nr:glycosyltransferase family 9 protein [Candidatus Caenarcaniphilales bacterium]
MRILIIKLSSFGDIIHSLPVLTTLKSLFPSSSISWVVSTKFIQLLRNHQLIDEIYELDNTLKSWAHNLKQIRKQDFDYVIDLQGLMKSGLFAKLCNAKKTIGIVPSREKLAGLFYSNKIQATNVLNPEVHIINRNLKILEAFKVTNHEVSKENTVFQLPVLTPPQILTNALGPQKKFIILAPETRWKSKNWPFENWISLIEILTEDNKNKVILLGSNAEFIHFPKLKNNNNLINLMGRTSIEDLMGILPLASLLIGGDSGILHLASAYGIKTLGLFGSTSPKRTGPWGGEYLYLGLDCSPCHKRTCKLDKVNELKCLKEITVNQVIQKVNQLLA